MDGVQSYKYQANFWRENIAMQKTKAPTCRYAELQAFLVNELQSHMLDETNVLVIAVRQEAYKETNGQLQQFCEKDRRR